MSYAEVFGGGSINPSQRTYLSLVTAVDVTLQWPVEQQVGGDNVATDIIDVDATVAGLNVDFDDATVVSNGFTSLMTNVGAQTVTVRSSVGGAIISLAPGESWFIYLTDNSTAAGVWRTFQLGATVSVANASALAGAGLKAISTTLNQTIPPTLTSTTPVDWSSGDRAQFTVWTGGVGVANLPDAAVVGSDWFTMIRNSGNGSITLTPPAGTIDSAATLIMSPGTSAIVVTDGTDFFTVGLGVSSTGTFDFLELSIPGGGAYVLAGVELNRISYRFIGVLTGNRIVVVPATVQEYWVDNSTTGAFTLSIQTSGQASPPQIIQGNRSILYCDGTDVLAADTSSFTPPVTIGQGGTGAVTAPLALDNLGAVPITRTLSAGTGINPSGLGDLSADRTINARTSSATQSGVIEIATQAEVDAAADSTRAVVPSTAPRVVMFSTPVAIALSGDNVWGTISDATLSAAGAKAALVRGYVSVAPTVSTFGANEMNLRETGSGQAAGAGVASNFVRSVADVDASGNGQGWQVNDAWVPLNSSQDFDILRHQTGTGVANEGAWILGYST